MAKKIKLDALSQVHGRVEKPITLDQVWGDTGKNKYGTLDQKEYEQKLNDYNKSDLQAHALKIGLVPIDNRENLIKRLKQEFIKHISQFRTRPTIDNSKGNSKKIKDILAEGR
jgi:hypothetical protein